MLLKHLYFASLSLSHSFAQAKRPFCAIMHFSLVSTASALTLSTLISSISAAAVEKGALVRRQYSSSATISYCTLDDVLGPLSEYVPDGPDATSFCSEFISITDSTECWTTVIPSTYVNLQCSSPEVRLLTVYRTVYVSTVYNTTVTSPTTTYDATVTATETETVIGLKRKRDADVAARAAVTPIVERAQLQARDFNTSAFIDYIVPALSSACTCLDITPGVVQTTCTASTSVSVCNSPVGFTRTLTSADSDRGRGGDSHFDCLHSCRWRDHHGDNHSQ